MEMLPVLGAWAAGSVSSLLGYGQHPLDISLNLNLNISAELGHRLSPNAAIYLPTDPGWANVTRRWNNFSPPTYAALVEVQTEKDIQETVRFANTHSIQFLAINGGHGSPQTLGNMKDGIGISMRRMKTLTLSDGGTSATLEPGLISSEVINILATHKKRTSTGSCSCTGMIGPMLGGGHSFLQGYYGTIADNLIEARVILAEGNAVTVSANSNPDLFWALRGAGHNFGIISEYKLKVHDYVTAENKWAFIELMFSGHQVEDLYRQINKLSNDGKTMHPVQLVYFASYIRDPDLDLENALIKLSMAYEGSTEEMEKFAKPFRQLNPVRVQESYSPYPDIPRLFGLGSEGPSCQPGLSNTIGWPLSMNTHNIATQREVFDAFNELTSKYPAFENSVFLDESYSLQGMRAVPDKSTAVADRQYNILLGIFLIYTEQTPENLEISKRYGNIIQKALLKGTGWTKRHIYVNYANGNESVAEIYGEPWRVQKLKRLKKQYDPNGRFNFYNPLTSEE